MLKPRQRHIVYLAVLAESLIVALGAFLANYLISNKSITTYFVSSLVFLLRIFRFEMFLLRDEWYE